MSFNARQDSIGKLLNDSIYRIPRNQRSYAWTEQNWNDLFRDFQLVVDGTARAPHFLGSIVLKREEDEAGLSVYTVIDGQQRILTLTILISSIIFVMKKRGLALDAAGTKKYVVAIDNKADERVIVDPEHHMSLPKIVNGVNAMESAPKKMATPTSCLSMWKIPSSKDQLIVKAFKFFIGELEKFGELELLKFRDAIITALYVNISSTTEEDLYTIFEILNARGLSLNDSDLLKNYIMRYIQPESRRDDAKVLWAEIEAIVGNNMTDFLRHYAIQCCRFTSGEKQGVYRKIRDYTDPHKAQDLLDDLRCKADYYSRIVNPTIGSKEGNVLSFLKTHRVKVFRPLIMSLMHRLDLEDISQQNYEDSLDFIYKFYICYKTIGGLESNSLTDSITKYAFTIERSFKAGETISDWRNSFLNKLPSKESFTKKFVALGWSHVHQSYGGNKNKDQCKVILELLESQKTGRWIVNEYTIEHILPDSCSEENAAIGNLLMLEHDLNEKCRDLSLQDKIQIYQKSSFASTRGFAERYNDKKFNIVSRTEFLAEFVYGLIKFQTG